MQTEIAAAMGSAHRAAGLPITPYDCQAADAIFFAALGDRTGIERTREYNRLRGAFNDAWTAAEIKSWRDEA